MLMDTICLKKTRPTPSYFIKPQYYMGRVANYFKLPTFRRNGIPAAAGTRPVLDNSSPTLIFKMLSFKRIDGTVRVYLI